MGLNMAGAAVRHLILMAVAAGSLAACQEGALPFAAASKPETGAAVTPPGATSVRLVDRDVEAPEVFQTTDLALWDGRPSLGGVWVASPEAQDPERVILRNTENGKFVIGALFRRERDNPGPTLQISSDAAAALGLLAGQPAKVSVTALRREENPATTDASKPLLDAAETAEGEAPGAGTVPEVLPKQAAIAQAPAQPPAASAAPAQPSAAPAAPAAKPAAAAPAAAKPAAPAPAAAAGGAHVLQIGIFSVEANANRAAEMLRKAGLAASVRKGETQGKAHWSVTASGSDRAALLASAKSLGFTDAYFLKN